MLGKIKIGLLYLYVSGVGSKRVKCILEQGQGLTFCRECTEPSNEGSHANVWETHFNVPGFKVAGDLIYGVPNDGSEDFYNHHHINGNIVMVDRGGDVPIFDKVQRAQDAGALAVLIADNGECTRDFDCGVLGKPSRNGFLQQDGMFKWRGIYIPSGMIQFDSAERIKTEMQLIKMHLQDVGLQRMIDEE